MDWRAVSRERPDSSASGGLRDAARRVYNSPMLPRDLLGPAIAALLGDEPAAPVVDVAVLRAARRAMATVFEVLLPFGRPSPSPPPRPPST